MTPTHFLSSHVGSGSDAHCLSGSTFTDATTSADVTAENSRNTQPTGAVVKDGGSASAVAARTRTLKQCQLIVKKIRQLSTVYSYRTLRHVTTKNDVISEKLVHCIFIFWVNTPNLTEWKRWVLVVLAIWWSIKINLQKLVGVCGCELPTNLQKFMQKRLNRSENIPKSFREGGSLLPTVPANQLYKHWYRPILPC